MSLTAAAASRPPSPGGEGRGEGERFPTTMARCTPETHPSTFELSQHGRPPLNSATGHCADHHIMRPVPKNRCPSCRNEGNWFEGKYGPFCSHRCKLIDLGKWLNEEARISEPLRPEHLEHFADLPPGQHLDQPESDPASQQ